MVILSILVVLSMFGCAFSAYIDNSKWYKPFVLTFSLLCLILFLVIVMNPKIKPIDVYRGKTTLEITNKVVDGIVIESDSVVILKD